ncbi:hypothetical protein VTL71DRAFT_7816 [Oculimacula yallundae]|uniref:Uncharacterized protein n=1 Tax=Oculimacula yallundae TaxID=86028 RepID=A0ABR4CW73_9HELO
MDKSSRFTPNPGGRVHIYHACAFGWEKVSSIAPGNSQCVVLHFLIILLRFSRVRKGWKDFWLDSVSSSLACLLAYSSNAERKNFVIVVSFLFAARSRASF